MSNTASVEAKRKARRAAYMRRWREKKRQAGLEREEQNRAFWDYFRNVVRQIVREEIELAMDDLRAELSAKYLGKSGDGTG